MALIKDKPEKVNSDIDVKEEILENNTKNNTIDVVGEQPKATINLTPEELDALFERKFQEREKAKEDNSTKQEVSTPAVEEQAVKLVNTDNIPELENFEYKDRRYELIGEAKSASFTLRSRGDKRQSLQYINPVTKQPFSLRLTSNQASFFEEKQPKEPGSCKIRYINIVDGRLFVPASDIMLQQFLHITPQRDVVFREVDSNKDAKKQLDILELRFKASTLARALDLPKQTAIARLICDDFSEQWGSSEVRYALFRKIDAHQKPQEIIMYCEDESLLIQSLAKTAVRRGYLTYNNYRFSDESGNLVLEVNRSENEYKQIGDYLLSNEGNKLRTHLESQMF